MVDKESVQAAYDKIAADYDEATDGTNVDDGQEKAVSLFLSVLSGECVLDAGCGGDPLTVADIETVGLDFSRGQLERSGTTETLVQGDMGTLPFDSNAFDGIVAFFSMIHIPLDDRANVYREFARVLRDRGVVLFTEGTDEWVGSQDDWLGAGEEMQWEMAGQEATKEHLKDAGFEVVDVIPVKDTLGDNEGTKMFFVAQLD